MNITISYDLTEEQAASLARIIDGTEHPTYIREVFDPDTLVLVLEVAIVSLDGTNLTVIKRDGSTHGKRPGIGDDFVDEVTAAHAVLWVAGNTAAQEPGDFLRKLIEAGFSADMGNQAGIRRAFPIVGEAIHQYKNVDGGHAVLAERAGLRK